MAKVIIPLNLHYVSGSAVPEPDAVVGQTLTWEFGLLAIGDERHITFEVTVDPPGGMDLLMNLYPDSRVEYLDYQNNRQSVPFPETRQDVQPCAPSLSIEKAVKGKGELSLW